MMNALDTTSEVPNLPPTPEQWGDVVRELKSAQSELMNLHEFLATNQYKDTSRRNGFILTMGERINAITRVLDGTEGRTL
jgi:hypothetical protein